MPTASTFSGYSLTNWGPLTTTFTAPASCATITSNVGVGLSATVSHLAYPVNCSTSYDGACAPTGTITSLEPIYTDLILDPKAGFEINYFSPGLYCPSGWKTVGVASRNGDQPAKFSGAFSSTALASITTGLQLYPNVSPNVLLQVLDPSETAVMCCPSSMTGNPYQGCYSMLSDYEVSAVCGRYISNDDYAVVTKTFFFEGTSIEAVIDSVTGTAPIITSVYTPPADQKSAIAGVTLAPFVTLVHKAQDLPQTTSTSSSGLKKKTARQRRITSPWAVLFLSSFLC